MTRRPSKPKRSPNRMPRRNRHGLIAGPRAQRRMSRATRPLAALPRGVSRRRSAVVHADAESLAIPAPGPTAPLARERRAVHRRRRARDVARGRCRDRSRDPGCRRHGASTRRAAARGGVGRTPVGADPGAHSAASDVPHDRDPDATAGRARAGHRARALGAHRRRAAPERWHPAADPSGAERRSGVRDRDRSASRARAAVGAALTPTES